MKLRCPYCKQTFGPEPTTQCPHCGKAMLTPRPVREKINPESVPKTAGAHSRRRRHRDHGDVSMADRTASFLTFTRHPRYLAALVILFVILGAMLVTRTSQRKEAVRREFLPEQRALHDLTTLRIALEVFHKDCGRYPSTRETLLPLLRPSKATGWDGPYIKTLLNDPWQTPYRYSLSAGVVHLTSDGPDKKPGTPDDIEAPVPILEDLFPPETTNSIIAL